MARHEVATSQSKEPTQKNAKCKLQTQTFDSPKNTGSNPVHRLIGSPVTKVRCCSRRGRLVCSGVGRGGCVAWGARQMLKYTVEGTKWADSRQAVGSAESVWQ